ncbi:hypothetical protein NLU13_9357 [Sarocladium strictum]|uniref:Peptidase S26 domain-containing protein n=1 Tax=Sarocladium strictum TaxID=5046 RepID=A0AA39L3S8_SARSR|nr:hypothetical protein NLU13_9357 [Sarocladium strictum]
MIYSVLSSLRQSSRRFYHTNVSPSRRSLFSNPWILGGTIFIQAACLVHYVFANVWSAQSARGPSMLPTLSVMGDWIVHDHTYHRGRGVVVGDLVSFRIPSQEGQVGVKRVIGMPGDYVLMGTPGEEGQDKMIQVPPGHCYVVGDNLEASRDSRNYGPVPLALIGSKIMARALPLKEAGWLGNSLRTISRTSDQ